MELRSFKYFIKKVFHEGDRLQKRNIKGTLLTRRKFTQTQIIAFIISLFSIILLPKGFSDNFAGFIISFLGIFIGLFTSIVITMHDKSKNLFSGIDHIEEIERARLIKIKNYLLQFTGLTAYSIVIGLIVIILLGLVLISDIAKTNIFEYTFISKLNEINVYSIFNFITILLILIHRFFIVYLLINFFTITMFSIASYFSFLISDYNRIKIKDQHEY